MNERIEQCQYLIARREGGRDRIKLDLVEGQLKLDEALLNTDQLEEAQTFIQTIAQQTQQVLEFRVGSIVTLALDAVFGEGWTFRVQFEMKRGRTEATLLFEDATGHSVDPMSEDGGGAVDVAAFALRVALWSLQRPRSRAVLVFDEPFLHLSKDHWPRMLNVIRDLAEKLELQLIIVTHEEELINAADAIFRIRKTEKSGSVIVKS